jgi:hypothetical protein
MAFRALLPLPAIIRRGRFPRPGLCAWKQTGKFEQTTVGNELSVRPFVIYRTSIHAVRKKNSTSYIIRFRAVQPRSVPKSFYLSITNSNICRNVDEVHTVVIA